MAEGRIDRVMVTLGAVAGTTGLLLLWKDAQKWRKVYLVAEQLSATKLELDAAEERLKQHDDIVGPHYNRVLHSRNKHQEMLDYCLQSDDPEDRKNIPEFQDRLNRLDSALEKMDWSHQACKTTRDRIERQYTDLTAELAALHVESHAAIDTEAPQISEDFFLSDWLNQLEADAAMFDDMMAESEEDECEDEGDQVTSLKFELTHLRNRKDELLEAEPSANIDVELNEVKNRMSEVLTVLNLFGFTVQEDRIITDGDDDDDSAVPLSTIADHAADKSHSDDPAQALSVASQSAVIQVPTDQCVFDWSEFEQPQARNYGYDEPVELVTQEEADALRIQYQREYQEHLAKNKDRILTWLQDVTSDLLTDCNEMGDELPLATGMEHLPEVEVGEWCFDEYDTSNQGVSALKMNQTRIAALFRISRQRFREGVQAELAINPSTALPQDWKEYDKQTYEAPFGDSESKPWI